MGNQQRTKERQTGCVCGGVRPQEVSAGSSGMRAWPKSGARTSLGYCKGRSLPFLASLS